MSAVELDTIIKMESLLLKGIGSIYLIGLIIKGITTIISTKIMKRF